MSLKSNLKVFIGIPNLADNDRYSNYRSYVLDSVSKQETGVEIMRPFITPPHAGVFQHGNDNRLNAIAGRMNVIIDKFITTDASHVMILDGDVELPPHAVDTLIRHDVDVASGVYPFHNFDDCNAMLFGRMSPTSTCGEFVPRDWEYMKGQVFGEKEPWSGGTGCILIKKRVFQRHHPRFDALRFNRYNDCGLDLLFWKTVQDAGFTARVDANVVCSHLPKYRLKDMDEWLT